MKRKLSGLSQPYQVVLLKRLQQGPRANPETAHGLGRPVVAVGMETLDMAITAGKTLEAQLWENQAVLEKHVAEQSAKMERRRGRGKVTSHQ
jgi:hypothetical protein